MMNEEIEKKISWFREAMVSPHWSEYVEDAEFLLTSLTEMEKRVKEVTKERDATYFDMVKYLERAEHAESNIKELEADLKLNASMLAKQCDLARDAETERHSLSKLLIEERIRIVKLCDAVEKYKNRWHTIARTGDEELYQAVEKVRKETK